MNHRDLLEKGNHLGRLIKESEMWLAELSNEPKSERILEKIEMVNDQYSKFNDELNELRDLCGPSSQDMKELSQKVSDIYVYLREVLEQKYIGENK